MSDPTVERLLRRTAIRKALGLAMGSRPNGVPSKAITVVASPSSSRCRFRSEEDVPGPERQEKGLSHTRVWYKCSHSDKPLGEYVCQCKGCGPPCKGYTPLPSPLGEMTLTAVPTPPTSPLPPSSPPLIWAYGVTTVPQRRDDLLIRTLSELIKAGFDKPRLFVDGGDDSISWSREFGLEVTCHYPAVRGWPNWIMGLTELFLRHPLADRYAMFQDDIISCRNLRAYLESCPYPPNGYLNLFSFMGNENLGKGWARTPLVTGRGAIALVFNRDAVVALLSANNSAQHTWNRLTEYYKGRLVINEKRGYRAIDGGVVGSLEKSNIYEYVHNPSLTQHVGYPGVIGNSPQPSSPNFVGRDFDALTLLTSKL